MRLRPLCCGGSRSARRGAQAAGLVRPDLPGAQVFLDVYSRSLGVLPSRRARRTSTPALCRQAQLRPIMMVVSCRRRGRLDGASYTHCRIVVRQNLGREGMVFVTAIEAAAVFTRPIHTVVRYFGSADVYPGTATLFFINAEGWALTCRHVAQGILGAEDVSQRYAAFVAERAALPSKNRRQLERELQRRYGFGKNAVVGVRNLFVNCVDGPLNARLELHPTLDLALIKFSEFHTLLCTEFPVFAADGDGLKQGKYLCRLGFPFPEFTNFGYDAATDQIEWLSEGRQDTARVPIEGMVTRHLLDAEGSVVGFELSTPGLRGQSGGPAFDVEGRVWGMQSQTAHLDLDFDVDVDVVRDGAKKRVRDSAFLHVGHCVHVEILKDFMRQHGVDFTEG